MNTQFHKDNLRHLSRFPDFFVTKRILSSLVVVLVFLFPPLIVVPLSSHEVDGVRKEKERLTAAIMIADWELLPAVHNIGALC
jgi:hypothetical protein